MASAEDEIQSLDPEESFVPGQGRSVSPAPPRGHPRPDSAGAERFWLGPGVNHQDCCCEKWSGLGLMERVAWLYQGQK